MAMRAGDIGLRAASAVVLAPAAVLAIWAGGLWFLALMLLACALLAIEWAMMSAAPAWRVMAGAVAFGLFAAVISAHVEQLSLALVMLVFCAAAAGRQRNARQGPGGAEAFAHVRHPQEGRWHDHREPLSRRVRG